MEMQSTMTHAQTQTDVTKKTHQSYEFLTGHDGHYLRKRTRLFEACVQVESNPELPEMKESAKWIAPKIPYAVIAECVAFFRAAWAEHGTEAIALLFLDDGKWSASAPPQTAGPASLSYESVQLGQRPVGSIHSHGAMRAFHSGTDLRDASEFDGIHLVVGRLDLPNPEFAAALHVNGKQFSIDPAEIVAGLPKPEPAGLYHPWLAMLTKASQFEKPEFHNDEEEDEDLWRHFMEL